MPEEPQGTGAGQAASSGGGGLERWWRGLSPNNRILVGVGAAAAGYLVWRYYKARQAAAAGSSSSGPSTLAVTSSQPQGPEPTSSVNLPNGASYSGPASGLAQVLGQLQPAAPAAPPAPAGPDLTPASAFAPVGQAYGSYPGAQVTTPSGTYYPLNPQEAAGITNQGGTLYYFPSPGIAEPATNVPFTQPTPLYGLAG